MTTTIINPQLHRARTIDACRSTHARASSIPALMAQAMPRYSRWIRWILRQLDLKGCYEWQQSSIIARGRFRNVHVP
jgi:hypothetical protein